MHCVRAVAWRPQSYSTSLLAPPPASHSSLGRLASRPRWSERVRVLKTPYSLSLCRAEPSQALSESLRRNQTQTLIFFSFHQDQSQESCVPTRLHSHLPPKAWQRGFATVSRFTDSEQEWGGRPAVLHPPKAWVLDPSSSHQSQTNCHWSAHASPSQDSSWVGICGQL